MSQPAWMIGTPSTRKRPGRANQIRTATIAARFQNTATPIVPNSLGLLSGYAAVYRQWSRIFDRSGSFYESVEPGAFRSAEQDPSAIRVLYSHGHDGFIGSRPLGPLTALRSDVYGLLYECPMFDNMAGRELLPGLQAGIFGSSYRFTVERDFYDPKPQATEWNRDRLPTRTILEATVLEAGPTPFPAFAGATAGMKQPAAADPLTMSANSTGSIGLTRTTRRTTRKSWELPASVATKPRSYLMKRSYL